MTSERSGNGSDSEKVGAGGQLVGVKLRLSNELANVLQLDHDIRTWGSMDCRRRETRTGVCSRRILGSCITVGDELNE